VAPRVDLRGHATIDEVIDGLEPILRDEVRRELPPESCMESCWILSELLADVGWRAWSLPVEAVVVNRAYVACEERDGPPADRDTMLRWEREHGAHAYLIGRDTWPGHLVLVTMDPDGQALWDPSIDQAAGVRCPLPKLAVLAPLDLHALAERVPIVGILTDGTQIRYQAHPSAVFCPASDWIDPASPTAASVQRVLARVRERAAWPC
jgi:hypothetical protein